MCLCGWEVLQHSKMGVKDRRRADEERNKTKETWAKRGRVGRWVRAAITAVTSG